MRRTRSSLPCFFALAAGLTLSATPVAAWTVTSSPAAQAAPTPETPAPEQDQASEHRSLALTPTTAAGPDAPDLTLEGVGGTAGAALGGTLELPSGITIVGIRWNGTQDAGASMRVHDGSSWGEWETLGEPVTESMEEATGEAWATEGTLIMDATRVEVRIDAGVEGATLETWTSQVTQDDHAEVAAVPPTTTGASGISVATRSQWAGNLDLIPGTAPIRSTPKLGVTVHHTATSAYYTQEQVPAMMRSIYQYHARTLGWGDMGYNMMIDRFGRVWEGRSGGLERNVQGAHSYGMNGHWFGLGVLGDHTISSVPAAEFAALNSATGWVLNLHGAKANGTVRYTNPTLGWTRNLPTIHGHSDVDATACPGHHLYGLLDVARQRVGAEQQLQRDAVQRLSGSDRYGSAAALAREAYLWGADTVYLTQGDELADALGAGPVASEAGAAVLLTRQASLPAETLKGLADLRAKRVVIVGGTSTISSGVESTLKNNGYAVRRVEGGNRYSTAVQLSYERTWDSDTVYLANGTVLADALGGAAAAAHVGAPMLLTRSGDLPSVTADRLRELKPGRVVVLGGEAAIGKKVVTQLKGLLPGADIDRIGGTDRYSTSSLVAQDTFDKASSAVVASGKASVDAIAGTQLAAARNAPVLLVRQGCRPGSVNAAYDELGISLSRLAGGSGVLDLAAGSTTC